MLLRCVLLLAFFSSTVCRGNDQFPGMEFEKSYPGIQSIYHGHAWPDGTVSLLGYGPRIPTIDLHGNVVASLDNLPYPAAAAFAADRSLFLADSPGASSLAIRKYDPEGRIVWSTNFSRNLALVLDLLPTEDGGVLALYMIDPPGQAFLQLLRLNGAGGVVWNRPLTSEWGHLYAQARIEAVGNEGYIIGTSSKQGVYQHKSAPHRGGGDVWIIRLNDQGERLWDRSYGGSANDSFHELQVLEDGFRIEATSLSDNDGNKTTSARGGADVWLIEVDSEGHIREQKAFGGSGDDTFLSFIKINAGYALLARSTSAPDGIHKNAPVTSPSGRPRSEWLLLLDEDFNLMAEESYEKQEFSGVASLVANQDESLLWLEDSTARRLSLRYAPNLAFNAESQNVFLGDSFTLKLLGEINVTGATLQWTLDGLVIPGATNRTFFIPEMGEDDAGDYQVTVATPFGSVTPKAITLAVAYAEARVDLVPSLTVRGIVGMRYRIEASTPIAPTVWATIDSLTLTNNPQRWIDLNAPPSQRFYRVRQE